MKIFKFLKYFDNFGRQVSFNFNRKGETINTALGGFCTI